MSQGSLSLRNDFSQMKMPTALAFLTGSMCHLCNAAAHTKTTNIEGSLGPLSNHTGNTARKLTSGKNAKAIVLDETSSRQLG